MVGDMATQADSLVSVRQYMELLAASDVRYEYWDGEAVAMSGTSLRHNLITMNIGGSFGSNCGGRIARLPIAIN